jgi:hypothetical protein
VTPTAPRFLPLFLAALAVRAGTVALGAWLASQPPRVLLPDGPAAVEVRRRVEQSGAGAIEPWFRWDAVWMANVARHGYSGAADRGGRLGVAFLPTVPATLAAGWRTLALLLAFPTALLFSAPCNESFGLLFTAIALAAWLAERPALAGAGALLGSLARMTGVALGVAAGCEGWSCWCPSRRCSPPGRS